MNEFEERLQRCFSAVFAGLGINEVRNASVASIAEWDSFANINLLCVVEEEFNIAIAADDLEGLTSYAAILRYLEAHNKSML